MAIYRWKWLHWHFPQQRLSFSAWLTDFTFTKKIKQDQNAVLGLKRLKKAKKIITPKN